MLFVVDDLISRADIDRIQYNLKGARFVDGNVTANIDKSRKNNAEMEPNERYLSVVEILDKALESSEKLQHRLMPRYRTHPIINRYDTGMFYANHVDASVQGRVNQMGRSPGRFGQNFIRTDYSMTLFLSDPDQYDGGELEINVVEETKLLKLGAGSAVFYTTGLDHAVRPVTRGVRLAAICWFQSMIRDVNIRRVLWTLYELEQALEGRGDQKGKHQAGEIRENMIRYLADI